GEIEAVLGEHPAVRQCVVVVRADGPGGEQLAAYVVGRDGPPAAAPGARQLPDFLRPRLPGDTVAPAFGVLGAPPLTPTGKIDRRALPAPDGRRTSAAPTPPQTPAEQTLATLWAELLRVPQVGRHDNFFELGGDSILALQLIGRGRQLGLHFTP